MTLIWKRHQTKLLWLTIMVAILSGVEQYISVTTEARRQGAVIINEMMATNGADLVDEDGDPTDWLELYNRSHEPVSLTNWYLTDDQTQPKKWALPDQILNSNEYLLIFASGKNRHTPNLHANFKLSRHGEFLGLYNATNDQFSDQLSPTFPAQQQDIAYGRQVNNPTMLAYLDPPTPGKANHASDSWSAMTAPLMFSQPRGLYTQSVTITLTHPHPDAIIHYTVDGRPPTLTSTRYITPFFLTNSTIIRVVAVVSDMLPSPIETHSFIYLNDILHQPPNPIGYPEAWGYYTEIDESQQPLGAPVQADYGMDARIVQDGETVQQALQALPTLSIALPRDELMTLYSNPHGRGRLWERTASVEYFAFDQPDFAVIAGLRIQGHAGRHRDVRKHSFRLFFRGEYGTPQLNYPLFPDSHVSRFNTLVLRAGTNKSFGGWWEEDDDDLRLTTYARDELVRASQVDMSGVGSHGIFVHLYLNGLYWGIYNIVERPDADFLAAYYGDKAEAWYAQNHAGIVDGTAERIDALTAKVVGLGGLENLDEATSYALLSDYVDMTHFIDYVILNWYAGTRDWPDNNWYAGIHNDETGQIRPFVWDAEGSWDNGAQIKLGKKKKSNLVKFLLEKLMLSVDFQIAFADRVYHNLYHDGPLTPTNTQARWRRITDPLEIAIPAESARWGDVWHEKPITVDDWRNARDDVLAQMIENNTKLITLLREAGYYPPIDPPIFNQHGGHIEPRFSLNMTNLQEHGDIYYTTNERDPRSLGSGDISPQARLYTAPLILTQTTVLNARVWLDGTWSASHVAIFRIEETQPPLQITEIMYHPLGGDQYEFIELQNIGPVSLDLTGFFFEGITYTFSDGILLSGERLVLAHNALAFAERYPDVPLAGVYTGQLANRGETITLRNARGNVLVSVTYDDAQGWPVSPDGRGDSLVLNETSRNPDSPYYWRASSQQHGNPGE